MTRRDQIIRLAEQVMGWHEENRVEPSLGYVNGYLTTRDGIERWDIQPNRIMVPLVPWNPYASIADAWMLVEAIQARYGVRFDLTRTSAVNAAAAFTDPDDVPVTVRASGEHATEDAICAAALRFVEVIEESNG